MTTTELEIITLTVEARGEVIHSNAQEFRASVRAVLASLNRDPSTDDEFVQAEQHVKALKGAEEAIVAIKAKALADAESVMLLFQNLDETSAEIRAARLELEKQISSRKEEIRDNVAEASLSLFDLPLHVARQHFKGDVLAAIKGKRTLDAIRKAAEIYVLSRNAVLNKSREKIDSYVKAHGNATVPDADALELRNPDVVEAELKRRFDAAKAAEEKRRMQAEIDEERKRNAELRGPKIGSIPVGSAAVAAAAAPAAAPEITLSNEVTEEQEFAWWRTEAKAALAALKVANEKLNHPGNIAWVGEFRATVNAAWVKPKKEGVAP